MTLQRQIDELQAQRASEWFEILKHGREEDIASFHEWCRQSPLHIWEFLEITWTEYSLNDLDAERSEDLDSLLRQISTKVRSLPARVGSAAGRAAEAAERTSHRSRWRWVAAAAVLAMAALVPLTLVHLWSPAEEFSTKVGEQRTVELADNSVVTLNTNSDLTVKFESGIRNIELHHGEAVFRVAPDPARPFRVHTRAGVVQAIGTQFNVYDRPDGTDVAVLEGRVRLFPQTTADGSPQDLSAGEAARIGFDGRIQRAEHADVLGAVAWSKRRLKFDNTPLEEMVRQFNRYHRSPQLRLEGVPPGSHHYSGIFDADDPEMLATFLERETDFTVQRLDREIVIRAGNQPGHSSR